MASLIFQLRVGHAPLNSYLHRFKKVDSDRCPACSDPHETAEHFLIDCPNYAHERWSLTTRTNRARLSSIDLLSNLKTIIPVINYIEATERFRGQEEQVQQAASQAAAQTQNQDQDQDKT
jgi:hypothetical protein